MIMPHFKDFPRTGRILGIDGGARRTGVAISDESREFVFTRPAIIAGREINVAKQIADLAISEHVVGIVIGLPLRMDGTESDTTSMVRDVAGRIANYTDLPICFIDETLTSATSADEKGLHDKKVVKEKLDSESAKIILENSIAVINSL